MSDLANPFDYEPWTNAVFRSCLARDGAFVDVGANVGQTLLKVQPLLRGPYVGFEPQLEGAAQVERLLKEMPHVQGMVLPLALADATGPVRLRRRSVGAVDPVPASSSFVDGFRPADFYGDAVWAFAAVGDDVLASVMPAPIATLKIDVEGAELEVLRGLARTLAAHQPVVLFEVLNHFMIVGRRPLAEDVIAFREARVAALERLLRNEDYVIGKILASGEIEIVDRICPLRTRHQRETMFIALRPGDLAAFGWKLRRREASRES